MTGKSHEFVGHHHHHSTPRLRCRRSSKAVLDGAVKLHRPTFDTHTQAAACAVASSLWEGPLFLLKLYVRSRLPWRNMPPTSRNTTTTVCSFKQHTVMVHGSKNCTLQKCIYTSTRYLGQIFTMSNIQNWQLTSFNWLNWQLIFTWRGRRSMGVRGIFFENNTAYLQHEIKASEHEIKTLRWRYCIWLTCLFSSITRSSSSIWKQSYNNTPR